MVETRKFSWLERQIVVLNVAGSSPVFHPNKNPCKLSTYEGFLFVGSGYLKSEIMAQSETLGDCVKMAQSENLGDCVKILIFAS